MKIQTRLVYPALIAAIYATLTIFLAPWGYGPVQLRFAEALCVLPFFSPFAVAGVSIGCLIANIASPYGLLDMAVGTSATLISAMLTYCCSKIKKGFFIAPWPPVVINAVFIGALIAYSGTAEQAFWPNFWFNACSIFISQALVCCVLGYPMMFALRKNNILK